MCDVCSICGEEFNTAVMLDDGTIICDTHYSLDTYYFAEITAGEVITGVNEYEKRGLSVYGF